MDGVLVDVTESYREPSQRTVEHFTGAASRPAREIQDYKNQGGWNDDWKLSHHMIRSGRGGPFEDRGRYFQRSSTATEPTA
jgi:HAD superfamily phosphatase